MRCIKEVASSRSSVSSATLSVNSSTHLASPFSLESDSGIWVAEGEQRERLGKVTEVQAKFIKGLSLYCENAAQNSGGARVPASNPAVVFESQTEPSLSLADYIKTLWDISLHYRMNDIDNSWKATYVLLKRFVSRFPKLLTPLTVHRVLLGAHTVAMKLTTERGLSNTILAKYGGVMLSNLNMMEVAFLQLMDYEVNVSRQDYISVLRDIANEVGCTTSSLPPHAAGLPHSLVSPTTATKRLSDALSYSHRSI